MMTTSFIMRKLSMESIDQNRDVFTIFQEALSCVIVFVSLFIVNQRTRYVLQDTGPFDGKSMSRRISQY